MFHGVIQKNNTGSFFETRCIFRRHHKARPQLWRISLTGLPVNISIRR